MLRTLQVRPTLYELQLTLDGERFTRIWTANLFDGGTQPGGIRYWGDITVDNGESVRIAHDPDTIREFRARARMDAGTPIPFAVSKE